MVGPEAVLPCLTRARCQSKDGKVLGSRRVSSKSALPNPHYQVGKTILFWILGVISIDGILEPLDWIRRAEEAWKELWGYGVLRRRHHPKREFR